MSSPVSRLGPRLDTNPYRQQPSPPRWPPEDTYCGGRYERPPTYDPWPPGTSRGARALAAQLKKALAVISMISGIAALMFMFAGAVGYPGSVVSAAGGMSAARYTQYGTSALIDAGSLVVLPGVLAFITGLVGLIWMGVSGGMKGGRGMAITGLTCGLAALCLGPLFLLFEFAIVVGDS
jgi:hypothetical protein